MLDRSLDDPQEVREKVKHCAKALKHRLGRHFTLEEEIHFLRKLV